jgi:hypothetical protein
MRSALVEVFIVESNSWFVSPIVELSISIPRNILWGDMWSDSKHSIAKVMISVQPFPTSAPFFLYF